MKELLAAQKAFFARGETLEVNYRICALKRLRDAIRDREGELNEALKADLNKSPQEAYLTETGMVLSEIDFAISHLRRWALPRRVPTPLSQFPARSLIIPVPYGCVLILSPWNYPFLLAVSPLVSALAAGNTAVVKPGEEAPATAAFLESLLRELFQPDYVAVVQGGAEASQALLAQAFDKIFFTGSPRVGRLVMAQAAQNLTPVTLELGGKSPCIVDQSADLPLAARRIVFGKFLNAGQTCVAPDYVLVQASVKERLLELLRGEIQAQYGDGLGNESYVRIVNRRHFDRLTGLLEGQRIYCGGRGDPATLKLEPTVLDGADPDSLVMTQEIFGPILPVIAWEERGEALRFVAGRPAPLALYLFTRDKAWGKELLGRVGFGGGCVNDTVVHLASPWLPFGGVGNSGMGACHGKAGFDAFTHEKSLLQRGGKPDLDMRYQPYSNRKSALVRFFLK